MRLWASVFPTSDQAGLAGKGAFMDRLSIFLTFMTGSVLVGGLVIVVLALGLYNWPAIAVAVAIGLFLTWPAAYVISRWIKRDDPDWKIRSGDPEAGKSGGTDFPET
jgi:hypothetical protein